MWDLYWFAWSLAILPYTPLNHQHIIHSSSYIFIFYKGANPTLTTQIFNHLSVSIRSCPYQNIKASLHNKMKISQQFNPINSLHINSSTPQILHNLQMASSSSHENGSSEVLTIQNHTILTIHHTIWPSRSSIPAPSSTNLFTSSKSPFSQASHTWSTSNKRENNIRLTCSSIDVLLPIIHF